MFDRYIDKYKRIILNRPIRNHLKVFDDDVFIVSYPRSGNTWIRFLLGTAVANRTVDWHNFEQIIPDIYRNTYQELQALARPRILKSHHSYDERYKKVIYVIRDVRDVFISYYNFHNKFRGKNSNLTLDEYLTRFIQGDLDDFGTWSSNISSWIDNADKIMNGFMILKYEDLVNDTRAQLISILSFLGKSKSEEEIDHIVEWASFKNMRKLEDQQQSASLFRNADNSLKFTNRGKVGSWREVLSKDQINLLESANERFLYEFGYKG